jgi:hypothetical protein
VKTEPVCRLPQRVECLEVAAGRQALARIRRPLRSLTEIRM